jgi:predicted AlkP superfamily pyrophosphatase or phosphodiesterase
LDRPAAERPTFNTLYFSAVDTAGHKFGPESEKVRAAVKAVDASLGELMVGLKARGIFERVNLIVVADHGMSAIHGQIFLEDYLDLAKAQVVDWSPVLAIRAKDGNHEALHQKLRKAGHMKVYRKAELPERFHYRNHPRVMPIIAVAEPGWEITTRKRFSEWKDPSRGAHGYDPASREMHAIFVAHGPDFRPGARLKPFENVHVYPAMAKILGLKPAPNDGDIGVLEKVMVKRRAASH